MMIITRIRCANRTVVAEAFAHMNVYHWLSSRLRFFGRFVFPRANLHCEYQQKVETTAGAVSLALSFSQISFLPLSALLFPQDLSFILLLPYFSLHCGFVSTRSLHNRARHIIYTSLPLA